MYSDYIVCVDESGDHSLEKIDSNYSVFVLALCVFRKDQYANQVCPAVSSFKFRHFGHDLVVLHERDIRKSQGDFAFLLNPSRRDEFLGDLQRLIEQCPFTIIAGAIHKQRLRARYTVPDNPYHLALAFGLERLTMHLRALTPAGAITHVVVEQRGKKEDADLELEFRRIVDGRNALEERLPFELIFADKKCNSPGLQIADLVARPIGQHVLNPNRPSRAFEAIRPKLRANERTGRVEGYGLKIFP